MEKIYLAGPMRGYPDMNYPAFAQWKAELEKQGLWVVSPAEMDKIFYLKLEHGDISNEDLRRLVIRIAVAMSECDSIFLMKGWKDSLGAVMEYNIARFTRLRIRFEEPEVVK